MGAELLVPLVISALSTGAGVYAQDRALREQDEAAAAGIRQQAFRQRQADERVDRQIAELAASTPDAERQASANQFLQQLRQQRAAASGAIPRVIGASDRYAQDAGAATAASDATAARVAELMSRIDAPTRQRRAEAERLGRTVVDVGGIARDAAADDFLTRLRVAAIRANPWLGALSQVGQGVAYGMAGRGAPQRLPGTPIYSTPTYGDAIPGRVA